MSQAPSIVAVLLAAVAAGCGGHRARSPILPPPAGPVVTARESPAPQLSPADVRAAERTSRRFLTAYLPYLYGKRAARGLPGVSPSVAASLQAGRSRATPAQRGRHPRLDHLQLVTQTRDSAHATAIVDDGSAPPYPVTFTVARRDGRWLIVALGDD